VIKFQREEIPPRLEIMPLLDVIFLLLTFFIYSMVLSVHAERLPVQMEHYSSGDPLSGNSESIFVTIRKNGQIAIGNKVTDRPAIELQKQIGLLKKNTRKETHKATIYLILEEANPNNPIIDRGPVLTNLFNELQKIDADVFFVGRAKK
tara:strand:+ start:509 stop:955 length:447 start_codon:yes stop_codon:yes gene_type:complete